MHRLSSAWSKIELAEWRHHHAEQGGRHDTISSLLHQQSNSNCYGFFRMYLTYIYASPAHAEPTHRCASNAPNSPAHTRIFVSHKTKASSAPLSSVSPRQARPISTMWRRPPGVACVSRGPPKSQRLNQVASPKPLPKAVLLPRLPIRTPKRSC